MQTLSQALESLKGFEWRTIEPQIAEDVGAFLEKALTEIINREQQVAQRERAASEREAKVQVREDQAAAKIKALGSAERLKERLTREGNGWFRRRA